MCPASASARAARAPKPLDAPVMTMTFFMTISPGLERGGSDDAAVGAERLAVDPAAVRAGEKRDHARDVVGLAEALERRSLRELPDDLVGLALQEQLGRGGARRDGVDGDPTPAELFGEDDRESLDARL